MMRPALAAAFFVMLAAAPVAVFAADPSEMLKDPAQERRAENLGRTLRCLVCQSESIEDSNADLARDLRVIVREQITAGQSDDQVRDFLVARYGDYVLLKPPVKTTTLVLWGGPFLLLLVGLVAAARYYRRRGSATAETAPPPLSAEEKRKLDALLKEPRA